MFVLQSYSLAVMFCLITMLCWGSWANTQKLASKSWPFQLFYWDYAFGILLISLVLALSMGSCGELGRSFVVDLKQASVAHLWSAFIGGVVFNLANILLVAAIDIAGMAVAFPIAIGLALVLGVVVNYWQMPVGDPRLLFSGVALVMLAIILDAMAYHGLSKQQAQKKPLLKGLTIALVAGVLMGFFYRFVASSMANDFVKPAAGFLTPYTAMVIFALGIVVSNLLFNTWMMKKPLSGKAVAMGDYVKQGDLRLHIIGLLGGVIWGIGSLFSFIASGVAGAAISYGLGQGATLIAACWGVFIWREFSGASRRIHGLLFAMFCCYIIGLGLIIMARSH